MRRIAAVIIACILAPSLSHAQQYGWQVVSQPSLSSSIAIQFVDSLNGWMGELLGPARIFRTRDGGFTWTPTQLPVPTNGARSISFADTSIGWAVAGGHIFRTTDGGLTWAEQFFMLDREYATNATLTQQKNLAGGYRGVSPDTALINRTTNGGAQWQEQAFPPLPRIVDMDFVDSLNGWASAYPSTLLRTRNGGNTWMGISIPNFVGRLSFVDTLHGWGLDDFNIRRTSDGGMTWQHLLSFGGDFGFNSLKFVDTLNGWAFGDTIIFGGFRELIYRTTNGGSSWYAESFGPRPPCNGTALDRYHAWAVSGNGHVLKYGLITNVNQRNTEIPKSFRLAQNYPNPFNPGTTIQYTLPKRTHVLLTVSDVLGRTVRVLVNTEQDVGVYSVEFDATGLASSRYFYTLKTGEFEETKPMVFVR